MALAGPAGMIGILLAAGSGRRFDPCGVRNKLLAALPDSTCVAEAAAAALLAVLPRVIAVVPDADGELAARLRALGCEVSACENSGAGMAASLVHAVRQCAAADGWLIALADMPYVKSSTIAAVCAALDEQTGIAVPCHGAQRGNPVAFHQRWLAHLLALEGDQGARALLAANPVIEVAVDDPGILRDIDTGADLA